MRKRVTSAAASSVDPEGEKVEFNFELEDGSSLSFIADHSTMVEISDRLLRATQDCARKRDELGKEYKPVRQDNLVRNLDLSSFAVLMGRDGLPRLTFRMSNGSTTVLRMAKADAIRWAEMFNALNSNL